MGKRRRRGEHALLILTAARYGVGRIDARAEYFVTEGAALAINVAPGADRVLSEDAEREMREALAQRQALGG